MKVLFIGAQIVVMILVMMPLRSTAGEVNNGGGFSEQNFIFAYSNLERFIEPCFFTEICKINSEQKTILSQIKASLEAERKMSPHPIFKSGVRKEFEFHIDGDLRIAVTGSNIGDPIVVNLDLIYPKDISGSERPFRVDEAIAILIHELGHHHGIVDHQILDLLGTKVQAASQNEVQVLSDAYGQIKLTVINQTHSTKIPKFLSIGLPVAMLSTESRSIDLSESLIEDFQRCAQGQTMTGVSIRNLKWKEAKRESLDRRKMLARACVAKVCTDGAGSQSLVSQNVEFELDFSLENSSNGFSKYEFAKNKLKMKSVHDWLPCN